MSITITVRSQGSTSGGTDQTIEGDGAIDTKEEAEAALTFLPQGSTDKVVAGKDTYTRDQLVSIRDAASGGEVQGDGLSHGVALSARATGDAGDVGHGETGFGPNYVLGIPLKTGEGLRLHFDGSVGPDFAGGSRDFTTPGGEPVESGYTSIAVAVGAALRLTPPILDHRLWASVGARGLVGGFGTEDSATVSLPTSCTPDAFGRGDCEPGAGSRSGNAGTQGLWNPRVHNARGTSGTLLGLDLILAVGATLARGKWGSLDLSAGPILSFRKLSPGDGDGISDDGPLAGGIIGVAARFGGADSYVPAPPVKVAKSVTPPPPKPPADKDGDGVPDDKDKCPDVAAAGTPDGCPVVALPPPPPDKDNDGIPDDKDKCPEVAGVAEMEGCPAMSATLPGSFAPGQPPTVTDIRSAKGQGKLEGVTYVIEAFDADGKSAGQLVVTDKPVTLQENKGARISLKAPDVTTAGKTKKGWQKEINYVVTLRNKEGQAIWTGSFEIGQAPAAKGGGKVRRKP